MKQLTVFTSYSVVLDPKRVAGGPKSLARPLVCPYMTYSYVAVSTYCRYYKGKKLLKEVDDFFASLLQRLSRYRRLAPAASQVQQNLLQRLSRYSRSAPEAPQVQ
jgi:hypothetical protein